MAKYLFIILALLFAGCGTVREWNRLGDLEKVTHSYGSAIRWNQFDMARAFIKHGESADQGPGSESIKKIKVTAYEVLNREVREDNLQAAQTVQIQYYHTEYMIQKTAVDKQLWEYDEMEKAWYLKSGLPDFK